MKPILLFITPNPALDLGGTVSRIIPNEKTYVHQPTVFPGGNGINAARIAHRLGASVDTTGFLGGGTGQQIRRFLEEEEVPHHFIQVEGMTRISITISNETAPLQTRLSFPGPRIHAKSASLLFKQANRLRPPALLILGGSLPEGFGPAQVRRVIRIGREHGVSTLVDVPGHSLREIIDAGPLFIKPNLAEFQEMIGRTPRSLASVLRELRELISRIPLICVSSVEGGALLASRHGAWFGKIPPVKVRSCVGAGDSMVGAIAFRLSRMLPGKRSDEITRESRHPGLPPTFEFDDKVLSELLAWGLSASCATLITPGTHLGNAADIRQFKNRIMLRKVQ